MEKYLEKIKEIKNSYLQSLWWSSKYNKHFINVNYFWDVKKIIWENIKSFEEKINNKIKELKFLKKELILDSKINFKEKLFLIKTINWILKKFLIIKFSIPLEAEKWWIFLEAKKRIILLNKINKLQNQTYWKEISNKKTEVKKIIVFLNKLLGNKKENLSKNEYKIFKNFLDSFFIVDKIQSKSILSLRVITKQSRKHCFKSISAFWITSLPFVMTIIPYLINNKLILKEEKNEFEDIKIIPEKIEKILNLVIELYKINWTSKISEVWNFSVDYDKKIINIPAKNITLKRLLEIIDHEIWVHIIRWENTLKNIWIAWENYQEIEEWFAVLSEKLIANNLKDIFLEPTIHHITTFFAENLDFENTRKMIEIYFKLIFKNEDLKVLKRNAFDRTKRVKSFVSIFEKWANRKDVSYTRWQEKIKKILSKKDNISFLKDFYFSKLWFDDLKYIGYFKEKYIFEEIFPIFVGKIIYEKLKNEKIDLEELKKKDFRFQVIKDFSKFEMDKIEEIKKIITFSKS